MENLILKLTPLYLSFLLLHVIAYVPSDNILLDCGSTANTTTPDGRNWTADSAGSSSSSTSSRKASTQDSSVQQVPYMTARFFTFPFTYSFPLTSGPKFVRLHFHPTSYPGFDTSKSFFSVTAGRYTLLRNFSASLTALSLNSSTIILEFSVNVDADTLNITFTPSHTHAFINGIEILSMPANLYAKGSDVPIPLLGQSTPFYIHINNTALETVYRLNVGGNDISPNEDTGMFRSWFQDIDYIFGAAVGIEDFDHNLPIQYTQTVPNYTAPEIVYQNARSMGPNPNINKNYNLTWFFPVDAGFNYLVRLHFCEIATEITTVNQRVFEIFLNNQTVEHQADIIAWSGRKGIAVNRDYIVMVQEGSGEQQDLWLALHPNTATRSMYYDALLNGLEIFKLSRPDGNLAGPVIRSSGMPAVDKPLVNKASKLTFTSIFILINFLFCIRDLLRSP